MSMADAPTKTTEPDKSDVAKEGFQQGSTETAAKPPESQQKTEPAQPRMFTEAEVQKFRQDEKDKVYGDLKKAQDEVAEFRKIEAARQKTEADAKAKAEADAK